MEEITGLKEVLNSNPDFNKLMNHPKVTREEKVKVVEDVFKKKASDELTGFLILIVNNGRYSELESVIDYFIAKVKEYKKIGVAYVSTPFPLTDIQKADIEKKLLNTTEYVKMEMNYSIDESLIGGMTIRIKDRVIDSSIKSKLNLLKKDLLGIQLSNA